MRLDRVDVPAFLDRIVDMHGGPAYGGARAKVARDCAVRVLTAVGLLPLPRRTIRRKPVGTMGGPVLHGHTPAPVLHPEVLRDPAVPACVPFADVELDDMGGPGWITLRASSAYGEASCRLACTFAHPLGSFACTGAGTGS